MEMLEKWMELMDFASDNLLAIEHTRFFNVASLSLHEILAAFSLQHSGHEQKDWY